MNIMFVRHGETNENASHCYLGHYDAKLNEKGLQQVRLLAEKMNSITEKKMTSIYSSDLSRAMETAQIIGNELQLIPVPIFSLRELHFGDWECMTYDAILEKEKEKLDKWIQNPYVFAPPNGETLLELGNRFDEWFKQMITKVEPNNTVIIVSHGGPIRWFLSKWIKGDINKFWNVKGVEHGKGIMIEFNEQTGIFTILTTF